MEPVPKNERLSSKGYSGNNAVVMKLNLILFAKKRVHYPYVSHCGNKKEKSSKNTKKMSQFFISLRSSLSLHRSDKKVDSVGTFHKDIGNGQNGTVCLPFGPF